MKTIELTTGLRLKTRYHGFAGDIRNKIKRGHYTRRLPTLNELAKAYGTHFTTMRKALELLQREGLIVIKQGSGIYLNTPRPHCIGITGSIRENSLFREYFIDSYFSRIFKHILPVIEERGDVFSVQAKKRTQSYDDLFKGNTNIDGVIIVIPPMRDQQELVRFCRRHPATVVIGNVRPDPNINYFDSDNVADSCMAVDYLIQQGHKRIAFVCDEGKSLTSLLRLRGYKLGLRRHHLPFDSSLVMIDNPPHATFAPTVTKVFGASAAPTAIFGASGYCSGKALELLGKRGHELDLVAYDDFQSGLSRLGMPYVVVDQPTSEIGRAAIDTLYGLIEGKIKKPVQLKLKSKLVFKGRNSEPDGAKEMTE